VALPYHLLGHCVEQGLLTPLDEDLLGHHRDSYVWWSETTEYRNRLYGVPLSALTMVLAIREDLFEQYDLTIPDTWNDYLALCETIQRRCLPVVPDLLQGSRHVTLWYDWLIHLYAHSNNDLVLYDRRRKPAHEAVSTLRDGTISYLRHAANLARHADGKGALPHWATANWDDGIEQFAQGNLLMHWVFNDALDTLRRRLEVIKPVAGRPSPRVRFIAMPKAIKSELRNAHVEGWILCIPESSRYKQAANELLNWFLDRSVQEEYARWGGASANLDVLKAQSERDLDRGAAAAYLNSVNDGRTAKTYIDLVKAKEPQVPHAIERIVSDLYTALISVNRGVASQQDEGSIDDLIHEATDLLLKRVEGRLTKHPG
jgi:ABC-type glycerol-3-phosphate transport system substrate-binding protein